MICLSISFAASVLDPAFVSQVSAMPCRAEHAAFSLNRPADVIALFNVCISCFPDVAVDFDPNLPFIFWNVIEIGLNALFISMHFGTSMWWYSSSGAVEVKDLFACVSVIVRFRILCVGGGLPCLRLGSVRRIFLLLCAACGVWLSGRGVCDETIGVWFWLNCRFLLWWGGIGGVCVFAEGRFVFWFGIMSRIESAVPWPPHARAAPRAMAFFPWVMCFKVIAVSSMSPMKVIVFRNVACWCLFSKGVRCGVSVRGYSL